MTETRITIELASDQQPVEFWRWKVERRSGLLAGWTVHAEGGDHNLAEAMMQARAAV